MESSDYAYEQMKTRENDFSDEMDEHPSAWKFSWSLIEPPRSHDSDWLSWWRTTMNQNKPVQPTIPKLYLVSSQVSNQREKIESLPSAATEANTKDQMQNFMNLDSWYSSYDKYEM